MSKCIYLSIVWLVGLIATGGFSNVAHAQLVEPKRQMVYRYVDSVDRATAEYWYRYSFLQGKRLTGMTVLQVGRRSARHSGSDAYYDDSLAWVLGNKAYDMQELMRRRRSLPLEGFHYPDWILHTNYPEGQVSIVESMGGLEHYLSQEKREAPQWRLVPDSTRQIMGYECSMAEADFHGRRWRAWYAPSLSMPYGPWLLHGLPGLVVEAYDLGREHEFLLVDITRYGSVIVLRRHDYMKVSRQEVIKRRKLYNEDRGKVMEQHTGVSITGGRSASPYTAIPYNPIRRIKPN